MRKTAVDAKRTKIQSGATLIAARFTLHGLHSFLHDWDDDQAAATLRNCRRAMAENGRLLLVDMAVPENGASCFSKLLDLNMVVMNGGRERTKAELCALLDAADYKLTRIIPAMAPQSVIEAMAK
jgi:hypothetical protein